MVRFFDPILKQVSEIGFSKKPTFCSICNILLRNYKAKNCKRHSINNGKFQKGITSWNKGKKGLLKHTEEWKKKQSEKMKGHLVSEETRKKIGGANKGKRYFGEKNPCWRGGITPINKKLRNSDDFILWRKSIFKRDNYTCKWCKQWGGKLHADHIKMWAFYPKLRFDINNGQTLCHKCHLWKTRWDMKIYVGKIIKSNLVYV